MAQSKRLAGRGTVVLGTELILTIHGFHSMQTKLTTRVLLALHRHQNVGLGVEPRPLNHQPNAVAF